MTYQKSEWNYHQQISLVNDKYQHELDRTIAYQCLNLAHEWGSHNFIIQAGDKKYCYAYVINNFDTSKVDMGVITSFFISIILRWVASWVVDIFITDRIRIHASHQEK